ncbi:hypothetical protein E1294_47740 [Nonomuraea diastatica]|uniref:Bacterial bifunctional deaminase-reductase C-terminal domain-containing protein n=1 Tax=Nonomuraea diastatica TaxID=1848329 RepID=A0A4V2YBK7_9ACTN|nr:hypothetical protein E1294_47740 [Nonomuraea diastatica]
MPPARPGRWEPGCQRILLPSEVIKHGLIDEHQVVVRPVLLGGGEKLFPDAKERLDLQLIDSQTFDARTVLLRHRSASR